MPITYLPWDSRNDTENDTENDMEAGLDANMNAEKNNQFYEAEECSLCRPGGFQMTETLFSFIEPEKREESLTVIDAGCGSGAAMRYLREKYPFWKIHGIDPNPPEQVMQEGKEPLPASEEPLKILAGEAEQMPFPDTSADVVLMECSFSKTWDPSRALSEVLRVLKPGGWLLMSDMYARKEEITGQGQMSGVLGRLESYKTIFKRLQDAGFAVLEMQDCSGELMQWIGQKIMDGGACELYANLGVDREALKRAGCGYFICAAKVSGLWETLNYTVENSPFYRGTWGKRQAAGEMQDHGETFRPGDWERFYRLPFSSAADIKENPERFVCVNPKEIARIITLYTSGSKGKPKRIFFTEQDLLRTADFFEKGMQYLITPGDSVTVYMEGPGRFSIGGLMKEGLARVGSGVTVHGLIRDMDLAAADGEGRDCFIGVPSQMYGLAVHAPHLRPKSVLLSADYVPQSVLEFLEETWKCRVYTHWGMTETGYGGGVQCGAREGYHLRDEDLLIEVVDPETGEPVKDGAYGELVLTTLRRRGMPLIRYRTGDLGRLLTDRCGCGCLKPRLDRVEGRLDDCLCLPDGKILSMHVLDEILFAVDGVQDFQAEVYGLLRQERRRDQLQEKDRRQEKDRLQKKELPQEKEPPLPQLQIYVLERSGMSAEEKKALLEEVKRRLEAHFQGALRIEAAGKEISPYIGSGKRKLQIVEEEAGM